MPEIRWLSRRIVDWIQREMIAEHGGIEGVRQGGDSLIESALARPRNRHAYEPEVGVSTLAAAYLCGLVQNHGYLDGNKRVGFACAVTFLRLNGHRLAVSEAEAYDLVMRVTAGSCTEDEAAEWIRAHSTLVNSV